MIQATASHLVSVDYFRVDRYRSRALNPMKKIDIGQYEAARSYFKAEEDDQYLPWCWRGEIVKVRRANRQTDMRMHGFQVANFAWAHICARIRTYTFSPSCNTINE